MRSSIAVGILLGAFLLLPLPSLGTTYHLDHLHEIQSALGLEPYLTPENQAHLEGLKIAVIDNGFAGYDPKLAMLPGSAKLVATYPKDFIERYGLGDPALNIDPAPTRHGILMAELVWALTGYDSRGPKFYLLNANGITNFRRAVRYAIQEKVDVILYSQNWECCGNFDGSGFVDTIANDAVKSGILWINAAGNYHDAVFNGTIAFIGDDDTVTWNEKSELRLKSHFDDNPVQIVLDWNSYGPEEDSGTKKDLDLYLLDESGQVVAKSELRQVTKKATLAAGESFLPREHLQLNLSRNDTGYYRLQVKAHSRNFTARDRVRIVVIPEKSPFPDPETKRLTPSIELVDKTTGKEIMVPADSPEVLTVGELGNESAVGPTEDGREKPDVLLKSSLASFSNGDTSIGTSNAAAYFAGAVLLMKAYRPGLTREQILAEPPYSAVDDTGTTRRISLSELENRKAPLYSVLTDACGESPLAAGRYQDGHYFLAIHQSPDLVLWKKCGIVEADRGSFEIYLREMPSASPAGQDEDDVICFVRSKARGSAPREPFPWELEGGDPGDYVRILPIYEVPAGNATTAPEEKPSKRKSHPWRAPRPETLRKE